MRSSLKYKTQVFILFAVLLTGGGSMAQDMDSKLPTDPSVIKGILPNGLTYYFRHNEKPEHKVELRLVVKAGSILEDDDQQGLAHFMEHMNFNGTVNFQRNDLVSYLQTIGVKFGADLNANTGFDRTLYILPLPTDDPANLEKGFQILEDWAHNALLTDADIDGERGVVLEESRLSKGAGKRMQQQYFPELLAGSRYAERLPLGKDSIIRNFNYAAIRRFYKDWYRPDLMAVIVVGDIDSETALKMIRTHFEQLRNPEHERPHFYADVTPRSSSAAMVVTDKEATTARLAIIYPYEEKTPEVTVKDYSDDIKRSLVVGMINRRFADLAQSGKSSSMAVSFNSLPHGYMAIEATCTFANEGPDKILHSLTAELSRARTYGFYQSELELVKKQIAGAWEKAYNERDKQNSNTYVGKYVGNFTDGASMCSVEDYYNIYKKILPSINVDDLNGLVKKLFRGRDFFALITAPDNAQLTLPTEGQLIRTVKRELNQGVDRMQEKEVDTVLLPIKPAAGTVTAREYHNDFDATTFTLSNGIKVTIKHTEYKNDEILLMGVKKGGSGKYGLEDKSNCEFLESVTRIMGVGSLAPVDFSRVTAGKNIRVSTSMGSVSDIVSGSSTVKDFESMMQLAFMQLTQPRRDESLFRSWKARYKRQLENVFNSPQTVFGDTVLKALYDNDPRAPGIPDPRDLDNIDISRLLAIYNKEFSYADGYQFFIVGNVDTSAAVPFIETYLGSLPRNNKPVEFKDDGLRPVSGRHRLTVHKGAEKKSMIMNMYYGAVPYSEDLALRAGVLAEILNIKVIQDLREKMSSIYSGGFSAAVIKEPYEHYSINLSLPCGPENVEKLLDAANEEIRTLKENGPDAVDLEKVRKQLYEKHMIRIKENNYWTSALESTLFWNKDYDHTLHFDSWIAGLTPADIQATAKLLFNGQNEFKALLMPE